MSVDDNKAVALEIMKGLASTTIDRDSFTDDATWWMLGRGELPIDEFAEMNNSLAQSLLAGPGQITIHGVTAEGERVAVEADVSVPLKRGGNYFNQYHFLILFRNGKAYRVKEYYDTAVAQRAFQDATLADRQ